MEKRYTIGVDFGSLSARALLADAQTGEEASQSTYAYPHAVMDTALPSGKKLAPDWALQHPQDYLDALGATVRDAVQKAGIRPEQVCGIGIDFTACTALPVLKDGTPLCFLEEYRDEPHAYVKLWKHHAAQKEADEINRLAEARGEKWLARYGGKISSEWEFPKLLQILRENEALYNKMDRFVEAADWVIWQLTGKETRNACTAGYKGIWHKQDGYPSEEFFEALDVRMKNVIGTKISADIAPLGQKAGTLTEAAARLTGLLPGTAVAVANVDAHVAVPAAGITDAGKMLMIIGTSTCDILLGEKERPVPGICGVVEDGVLPGWFGYEAGQSCVGDHFDWFVKNCVPERDAAEARKNGTSIHAYLREQAQKLEPGESGLVALDWWNGNRSILVDADLTGLIAGMTLTTRPHEIYRALIEATAYGKRVIIEAFEKNGVPVTALYAAGGIAKKDAMMMQIYADVTGREIKVVQSDQTPALGSAIFAAVAAGVYADVRQAAAAMASAAEKVYRPIPAHKAQYDLLYAEYLQLHDYFGRGGNDMMKRLKQIKQQVRSHA